VKSAPSLYPPFHLPVFVTEEHALHALKVLVPARFERGLPHKLVGRDAPLLAFGRVVDSAHSVEPRAVLSNQRWLERLDVYLPVDHAFLDVGYEVAFVPVLVGRIGVAEDGELFPTLKQQRQFVAGMDEVGRLERAVESLEPRLTTPWIEAHAEPLVDCGKFRLRQRIPAFKRGIVRGGVAEQRTQVFDMLDPEHRLEDGAPVLGVDRLQDEAVEKRIHGD